MRRGGGERWEGWGGLGLYGGVGINLVVSIHTTSSVREKAVEVE